MQKYTSLLTNSPANYILPPETKINDSLSMIDYEGYIPNNILRDLINIASNQIINNSAEEAINEASAYTSSLVKLFRKLNNSIYEKLNSPIHIAVNVLKLMHQGGIDFRLLEKVRASKADVNSCYSSTFNYKFDLKELSYEVLEFLNISKAQIQQIERLPDEIIHILNFNNDIGKSLFPSRITTEVVYDKLRSYSQISKIKKTVMCRPDFISKFAIKDLNVKYTENQIENGKRLVIGMSTNTRLNIYLQMIIKLLGVLVLTHKRYGLSTDITLYLDLGNGIKKLDISDATDFFRSSFQLSMFNQPNSKFLSHIAFNEPNSSILFVPIPDQPCALSSTSLNGCRINMLAPGSSKLITRYKYMCSKTGGKVIAL